MTIGAVDILCHTWMDKLPVSFASVVVGVVLGLLLRIFSYWYDMDVIEEESFFKWKEDVHQQYPGKGLALFQVWN